jgi:hypothetical protein
VPASAAGETGQDAALVALQQRTVADTPKWELLHRAEKGHVQALLHCVSDSVESVLCNSQTSLNNDNSISIAAESKK